MFESDLTDLKAIILPAQSILERCNPSPLSCRDVIVWLDLTATEALGVAEGANQSGLNILQRHIQRRLDSLARAKVGLRLGWRRLQMGHFSEICWKLGLSIWDLQETATGLDETLDLKCPSNDWTAGWTADWKAYLACFTLEDIMDLLYTSEQIWFSEVYDFFGFGCASPASTGPGNFWFVWFLTFVGVFFTYNLFPCCSLPLSDPFLNILHRSKS